MLAVIIAVIVTFVVCVPVTLAISNANHKKQNEKKIGGAEEQARQIIDDAVKNAEAKKREAMLEAKEENLKLKNELDKEIADRRAEVSKNENRILQKEENLDRKIEAAERREANFHRKEDELRKKEDELEKISQKRAQELERISGLTTDEAKKMLLDDINAKYSDFYSKLLQLNQQQNSKNPPMTLFMLSPPWLFSTAMGSISLLRLSSR